MFLFAGHDPGAKNHIRPIHAHAISLGIATEFIDLSSRTDLLDDHRALTLITTLKPRLLITGSSMNQAEWPLIRACKSSAVPTAMVVDLGAEGKLDPINCIDFPDRFLVTNPGCLREVIEYGAHPDTVVLTGSTHLEFLYANRSEKNDIAAERHYGLTSKHNLVSFFCAPTVAAIDAVVSLATLLPTTDLDSPAIVVRPHPRDRNKDQLESACGQFDFVHYDAGDHVTTPALLLSSRFSLSMASTVSLESLVLGTPSAFYQIGWDFVELDQLYRNVEGMTIIRRSEQLGQFVANVLKNSGGPVIEEIESYSGALERTWRVISELNEYP